MEAQRRALGCHNSFLIAPEPLAREPAPSSLLILIHIRIDTVHIHKTLHKSGGKFIMSYSHSRSATPE